MLGLCCELLGQYQDMTILAEDYWDKMLCSLRPFVIIPALYLQLKELAKWTVYLLTFKHEPNLTIMSMITKELDKTNPHQQSIKTLTKIDKQKCASKIMRAYLLAFFICK